MQNHSCLEFGKVNENEWLIRDTNSNDPVGILNSTVTENGTPFVEIRGFGPFKEGDRIAGAWMPGPIHFREWIQSELQTLFGCNEIKVTLAGGATAGNPYDYLEAMISKPTNGST